MKYFTYKKITVTVDKNGYVLWAGLGFDIKCTKPNFRKVI